MNIFERLYNKVFHNEALIKENELEREMFNKLEILSKDSKFSASQRAKKMIDCVEKYLGEIVKNRGNLWTGRNKVSKFLSNIRKKGSIEDKVSYLAGITKDKKFGGSYWAQKIGPIFSETENANMMNAFARLEYWGLIDRENNFDDYILNFDNVRGIIFKFGEEKKMAKIYDSEVILKNIDSCILELFCVICKDLGSFLQGRNTEVLGCAKFKNSKKVSKENMIELMREIKYFQSKRHDILGVVCSETKENFDMGDHHAPSFLGAMYGFYSQGGNKMKKIVDKLWEEVASELVNDD